MAKRPRNDVDDDNDEWSAEAAALKQMSGGAPTSMAKLYQKELPIDWDARLAATWPDPASPTPYAFVADTFADISAVGSRLECAKLLALMFWAIRERCPDDLRAAVYVTLNRPSPAHEGLELGVGDATLIKVVSEVCGMVEKRVKEEYTKSGDLAELAQRSKRNVQTLVKPRPLLLARVFKAYRDVATTGGKDTQRRRIDAIIALLRDAKGPEVNFLVRAFQGKMRMGLAEPTVLLSLGHALTLHYLGQQRSKELSPEALQGFLNLGAEGIARIYHEVPSVDVVLPAVLAHGFELLVPGSAVAAAHGRALSIRPGLPVRPQLAHPTNGITTILDRFQGKEFTCEYKYDGERAQIHYEGGVFSIFSRNSETHTGKYPDIIARMPNAFDPTVTTSFILDSEVVAVDSATGALQAFQVLQHRGRKNIDAKEITIHVCVFAFDILYLNGEPVLHRTLKERRALLYQHFRAVPAEFAFATHMDANGDVDAMQAFLAQSITDGCEGLMVKTLVDEAAYTPAKRSHFWLKLKKDYMEGATDTLDLVPIGAYHGKGKRTGVYGGFLLACYDPETEEYQSICKIGTGFQDVDLENLTNALQPAVVPTMPPYYRTNDAPDVWLAERAVWEIRAADLSISPVHHAGYGLVAPGKGIALRFPRFLRARDDKGPTDATTAAQVADMYRQQSLTLAAANGGADANDDD